MTDPREIAPLQDELQTGLSSATTTLIETKYKHISIDCPAFVPKAIREFNNDVVQSGTGATENLRSYMINTIEERKQHESHQLELATRRVAKDTELKKKISEAISVIDQKIAVQVNAMKSALDNVRLVAARVSVSTDALPSIDNMIDSLAPSSNEIDAAIEKIDKLAGVARCEKIYSVIASCSVKANAMGRISCKNAINTFASAFQDFELFKTQVHQLTIEQGTVVCALEAPYEPLYKIKQANKATEPDEKGFRARHMDVIKNAADYGIGQWLTVAVTLGLENTFGKLTPHLIINKLPEMIIFASFTATCLYAAEIVNIVSCIPPIAIDAKFDLRYGCGSCKFADYIESLGDIECPRCATVFFAIGEQVNDFVANYFVLASGLIAQAATEGNGQDINLFGQIMYFNIFVEDFNFPKALEPHRPSMEEFAKKFTLQHATEILLGISKPAESDSIESYIAKQIQFTACGSEAFIRAGYEQLKICNAYIMDVYVEQPSTSTIVAFYNLDLIEYTEELVYDALIPFGDISDNASLNEFTGAAHHTKKAVSEGYIKDYDEEYAEDYEDDGII